MRPSVWLQVEAGWCTTWVLKLRGQNMFLALTCETAPRARGLGLLERDC